MLVKPNDLQWDGGPGHYEVYYLTLTDPATGVGIWIRYTMLAPLESARTPATCAVWLLAMDPRPGAQPTFGRKAVFPIDELHAQSEQFKLRVDGAILTDSGITNKSTFALTGWRFEARDGDRRLVGKVDASREQLAGVTYHDPDGELAYCYNCETASMRLHVYERARRVGGWAHRATLFANGRAHFEYAQRTPIPDLELLTT